MSAEIKSRKVMIVIEDDGQDKFKFYLAGDIERIGLPQIPVSLYSAAEFWGVEFMAACHEKLRQSQSAKPFNRQERRAQNAKP